MKSRPVDAVRWWQESVGQVAPIGRSLRGFLADRWIRFHSLPLSKRYAETPAENAELLRRHVAITDDLFAVGEQIFIFCSQLVQSETQTGALQKLRGRRLSKPLVNLPANPVSVRREDDDFYSVQAIVGSWRPRSFDDFVQAVANEELWGVCCVSPASGNVYCPYDGGMDVFPAPNRRHEFQSKFAHWRSLRDDGL